MRRPLAGRRPAALLIAVAVTFFAVACDRSEQRLEEAAAFFDSGDFTSARDLLLEHRLHTEPEGAELLAASYLALDEDAAALALVLNDHRRFTPTSRTDVCVVSMLGARNAGEYELLRTRRDSCSEIAEVGRVDFEILSELVDAHSADASLDKLGELTERLNQAPPSPELDAAAGFVSDYGLRWIDEASTDVERGARIVSAIHTLDAPEYRPLLADVQLELLENASIELLSACIDAFRDELGGVAEDDGGIAQRLARLAARAAPSADTDDATEESDEAAEADAFRDQCPVARLAD